MFEMGFKGKVKAQVGFIKEEINDWLSHLKWKNL